MTNIIQQFAIFLKSSLNQNLRDKLFESIWKEYYQKLTVFVKLMIKDNSFDIEDITQDIMIKVYKNLHKYNPFYSFNTWFYTIAKNLCIDFLKKTSIDKKTSRINDTFEISEENELLNQEEILIADEIKNLIASYIKNLDDSDQQISFLRFYEKVSYKNISKITNIPTGTVKYRVHIIRSGIKKVLEKYYEN